MSDLARLRDIFVKASFYSSDRPQREMSVAEGVVAVIEALAAEAERQGDEDRFRYWRDIPKGHIHDVLSGWYMEGTADDSQNPIADWLRAHLGGTEATDE